MQYIHGLNSAFVQCLAMRPVEALYTFISAMHKMSVHRRTSHPPHGNVAQRIF